MSNFDCAECGGKVTPKQGRGRMRVFRRGVEPFEIPETFPLHTCECCGETYVLPEQVPALEAELRVAFLEWQSKKIEEWVSLLECRHGVTRGRIATACGITPSYLSHLIAGTDLASVTLQRLLEAFVASAGEFQRHLEGRPLCRDAYYPCGVSNRAPLELEPINDYEWLEGIEPSAQDHHPCQLYVVDAA